MEAIIEHSKTKREIKGDFRLCGNRDDLRKIGKQILEQVDDDFNYGWIDIRDCKQEPIVNTKPKSWDE